MNPILCAIDTTDPRRAEALTVAAGPHIGGVKLGLEFFCANGPAAVGKIGRGASALFLDLKLHDIPNTVAGAVRGAARLEPSFLTVHCAGGPAMLRAAAEAARSVAEGGSPRVQLLGVTVLTSLDESDLEAVGQRGPVSEQTLRLAGLAQSCGLDGVICSPLEITALRNRCGPGFVLVVPGIRPAGAARGDQKRVMGPREALDAGADYLVIGRPITAAADPASAAQAIVQEIAR